MTSQSDSSMIIEGDQELKKLRSTNYLEFLKELNKKLKYIQKINQEDDIYKQRQ